VLGLNGEGGAARLRGLFTMGVLAGGTKANRRSRFLQALINLGALPLLLSLQRLRKKLSYLEAREYATIEQRVAEAEQALQQKRAQLEDPAIASDGPRLLTAHAEMDDAQKIADELYSRWAELEQKKE